MAAVRIQKVLAEAGISSRRQAEELILAGRVEVNGKLVTQLPCFVDPQADQVRVDGQAVRFRGGPRQTLLLNKPKGVSAGPAGERAGQPNVLDLVPPMRPPVCVVGGLDADSTGLVVITNDGELADRLNHPRYGHERTYVVEVDGRMDQATADALRAGVFLDERRVPGVRLVKVLGRQADSTLLEVHAVEVVSRQVQRMLAKVRHKPRRLRRVGLGPLRQTGLKIGHFRRLSEIEVRNIKQPSEPIDQAQEERPHSRAGLRGRGRSPKRAPQVQPMAGAAQAKGHGRTSAGRGKAPAGRRRTEHGKAQGVPRGRAAGGKGTGQARGRQGKLSGGPRRRRKRS